MGSFNDKWNLILGISLFAILIMAVGVAITVYPYFTKRLNSNAKKNERKKSIYFKGDINIGFEEKAGSEYEDITIESRRMNHVLNNTEVECSLEYRTRGSQLIVVLSRVYPCARCSEYNIKTNNAKLYFIVYLNGENNNSPCESTLKQFDNKIDVNEIFVFTVMPYDLPALELMIQVVLASNNRKFVIGTLKLSLFELDQRLNAIQKSYSVPFPVTKTTLSDCLLCLSITISRNLVKVKIIRLHIFDCSFPDDNITGLHLKLILSGSEKSPQVFETTKKKYKSSLMFNETTIFDTTELEKKDIRLSIQLIECCSTNGVEIENICGTINMNSGIFEDNNFYQTWMEAMGNMENEVVRWYPITYNRM